MPLTDKGFERLSFQSILQNKIEKAKELFGNDIDTSEQTALGKFIRINAFDIAEAEEEAENIYYSIFPGTARGVSLDRLCDFVGISRNPATYAQYDVTLTGLDGYIVPIGFMVGSISGESYYNVKDTEIIDGKCTIRVWCTESGTEGNVEVEAITRIINPIAEVTAITGVELVAEAQEEETDYELRKRFELAREGSGSCSEVAIKAALMRIPTVESVNIIKNDTAYTVNNRPAFSFECFINGGENYHKEIAETIFNKKPIGIRTCGQISQTIEDEYGETHNINFSHTEIVNIIVEVDIIKNPYFAGDTGKEEIAENITSYINDLEVGENVIISTLYGLIHQVAGVEEVTGIRLSRDNEIPEAKNIIITEEEIANCKSVIVEVEADD